MKLTLDDDIEVLVASYGGVGTSMLIEFLSQYRKCNAADNSDGWKHIDVPPLTQSQNVKTIYIYGDPNIATISLFRRNFHYAHSISMLHGHCFSTTVKFTSTLDDFISVGKDRFQFREHIANWTVRGWTSYPILFIRFETLWENLPALFDFIGIARADLDQFPVQRKRSSNTTSLDSDKNRQLVEIYRDVTPMLDALGDIWVREKGTGSKALSRWRHIAYACGYFVRSWLRRHSPAFVVSAVRRMSKSSSGN